MVSNWVAILEWFLFLYLDTEFSLFSNHVGCYIIENPLYILKSLEILSIHNIHFNYPTIFEFCTEHGSDTAVLCAKFEKDWTTNKKVKGNQVFAKFEFKMISFRHISCILTATRDFQACSINFHSWISMQEGRQLQNCFPALPHVSS